MWWRGFNFSSKQNETILWIPITLADNNAEYGNAKSTRAAQWITTSTTWHRALYSNSSRPNLFNEISPVGDCSVDYLFGIEKKKKNTVMNSNQLLKSPWNPINQLIILELSICSANVLLQFLSLTNTQDNKRSPVKININESERANYPHFCSTSKWISQLHRYLSISDEIVQDERAQKSGSPCQQNVTALESCGCQLNRRPKCS